MSIAVQDFWPLICNVTASKLRYWDGLAVLQSRQ